jgi:hypothetical protein
MGIDVVLAIGKPPFLLASMLAPPARLRNWAPTDGLRVPDDRCVTPV